MIIGCTCSPDYNYPTLACILQDELCAENAFCFDLNAACSGFIYALDIAQHYLATGKKNILIVCSEVISKQLDFTDRSNCVLFGDGAAAVLVKPSEDGLYASYLKSKGDLGGALVSLYMEPQGIFATDKDNPKYQKFEKTTGHFMGMKGNDVYRFAVKAMPEAIENACESAGLEISELDLIIPHQANIRIINAAAERLQVEMDKVYVNVDRLWQYIGAFLYRFVLPN